MRRKKQKVKERKQRTEKEKAEEDDDDEEMEGEEQQEYMFGSQLRHQIGQMEGRLQAPTSSLIVFPLFLGSRGGGREPGVSFGFNSYKFTKCPLQRLLSKNIIISIDIEFLEPEFTPMARIRTFIDFLYMSKWIITVRCIQRHLVQITFLSFFYF